MNNFSKNIILRRPRTQAAKAAFRAAPKAAAAAGALALLGLAGCIAAPPFGGYKNGGYSQFSRGEDEYESRRRNDRDRDSVLDRARERYSNRERCSSSRECKQICDDIYDRRRDKEDCESLPIPQIEALSEIYKTVKSPDYDDLIEIGRDDFDVLINISIKPLDKLIRKYSRQEAKETLRWIASDSDIAEVFKKEDDEYSSLKDLFDKISPSSGGIVGALKATVYSGRSFLSIAVEESNEEAGELIHYLMESKRGPTECNDGISKAACLRAYCEIGKKMYRDTGEDLPDFDYFESYLEGIVRRGINGKCWKIGHRTEGNDRDGDSRDALRHGTEANGPCKGKKNGTCVPFDDMDGMLSETSDKWWLGVCSFLPDGNPCLPDEVPG